jgi:nucleotide-binding universal stress UspA family protein
MKTRTARQVHQEGHQRKFLVIVDDTPECESAVYFAACRARNTKSKIAMLYVHEPEEFQHWLTIEEIHREEGEHLATALMRLYQRKLRNWGFEDIVADELVRHGDIREQITEVIDEDTDIAFLVLGASTSAQGPGRLVSWIASSQAGHFPIPVVLVPGALELEEIEALS